MHVHDYVERKPVTKCGKRTSCLISRYKCTSSSGCKQRYFRVIPYTLMPFKHYVSDIVEDVITGKEDEDSLCVTDGPCEKTIVLWRQWFLLNRYKMEADLRRNFSKLYELEWRILSETKSLIDSLKECGKLWLPFLLSLLYALGSPPDVFY